MLVDRYNSMIKNTAELHDLDLTFLEKYFMTKTMQRLKGKGLFCGMDYVGIDAMRPIEKYTRLDHSKNVAYSAWSLSLDKSITLAGAFHDVGTLSFAHVNSFKKGQGLTQSDDELDVKSVLMNDSELLSFLKQDGININDVINYSKYPLLDKEIPALCLDRVDGILATCLFWAKTHNLKQITELYNMLCYFENLNGMCIDLNDERFTNFNGEIAISEQNGDADYEDFFKAINVYSKILLTKESRYLMQVFGLVLKFYEDKGIINEKDLFHLTEEEVINQILNSKYRYIWEDFINVDKVEYAKPNEEGLIIFSKPKIRQANPLCMGQMEVCEIDGISGEFYRELNDLREDIKLVDRFLVGNLDKRTVKVLSLYK